MTSSLVVLARSPRAGEGKTRLRRALPARAVDAVAEAMVADTLAWSAGTSFDRLVVAYRGPLSAFLRQVAPGALWVEQAEGNLGDRIEAALEVALDAPQAVAVQIGTDSPTLPAGLLEMALAALGSAPAALIPAADGGWVALGTTGALLGALAGVHWSRADTCTNTANALTAAGLPPLLLPSHYDVDEPADLLRLAADPDAPSRAPRTLSVIVPLLPRLRDLVGSASERAGDPR